MEWRSWWKTEPDKARLEMAIDRTQRKLGRHPDGGDRKERITMTNIERNRPYDPKPPKASISLGDYTGQVVGFFECGGYEDDPNPQFENSEYVPVGHFVVFEKPVTQGPQEITKDWRCFNAKLRHQLVDEPAVIGQLAGKGRAGSPYEVLPLPDNDRGNSAYQFVFDTAIREGWIASEGSSAARKPITEEDDEYGEF